MKNKHKKILSEEHKRKIRESLKGRLLTPMTPEIIEKIRKSKIGIPNPKISYSLKKGYAEGKYNHWCKGKTYEEIFGKEKAKELKKLMGKQNIGKINWSKGLTKETDERIKKRSINSHFRNPNFNNIHRDKIQKGLIKRPNNYEKKISLLLIENNLPFIYTGNRTFLIGNKNPDFKHINLPIVIEVYNSYHHDNNYEEERGNYFKKFGYKTIFINDNDILNDNWKQICFNKIKENLII
jgi:very-short-patch-repair endonuclease